MLPVDKPDGPTSHDVVAAVRKALDTRRVGHTGTLDPFASGLLLVCIGPATRLAEYLADLPKTYTGTMRLGETTDTDDRTGRTLATSDTWRKLDAAAVNAALGGQRGRIMQRPPLYSAKRVRGERMYRRARRGERDGPEPVPVVIHRIRTLSLDLPDVDFEVECSRGTYVRAIARDVGEALGTGAHLVALRRTRIGGHDVARAVPLDRIDEPTAVRNARMRPLGALAHLPAVEVDDAAANRLAHGATVARPEGSPADGRVAVAYRGELLAVAEAGADRLQPRKVFARE